VTDIQKTLVGAKALLQKHGWAQRCSVDRDGCYCMVHAVVESAAAVASVERVVQLSIDACALIRNALGGVDPIVWNDESTRTLADVESLLSQLAANEPKATT